MSGKYYTMKERKAIVEYLTEHRAYSEIKGRKMWMDLASSKLTNRTWQSLKKIFLQCILPDIHNPYYKLTSSQISSFRQGQDIEAKLNNRLQIRSTSQNSGLKEKDAEKPGNSNNNGNIEGEIAGEDPKQSHVRASTGTLVLENCYETADDIRKDLQSPTDHTNQEEEIDDFVMDDEEREPQMQIVEPEDTKIGDTSRRQRIGTDCRKRTISHSRHRSKYASDSSGSSDWTSDTGSEYVSPPPRKYRRMGKHTGKYFKRAKSNEEDKETVKLKFTEYNINKDGEQKKDLDAEGPSWAMNPMLQQFAQKWPFSRATSAADRPASTDHADEKSGNSTPIEEVQKKINQNEQEKYHEEEIKASDPPPEALNVTKRRGSPRKISPSPAAKRSKPNETGGQDISADPPAQPSRVENTTAATRP